MLRQAVLLTTGALVLALAAVGCGGKAQKSSPPAAASGSAPPPSCPAAWKAGWQRLADQIGAPVYCPSWVPQPLDARMGGPYFNGRFVDPDRSYLVSFVWMEVDSGGVQEVHVNFRGYPGRTAIPVCEDTVTDNGKTLHPRIPCFSDARGRKRFGAAVVTMYTANQGVDQWHILYAWRHRGSLYSVSEHVAPPFTYAQVVANLDHMMRGLVLLNPAT